MTVTVYDEFRAETIGRAKRFETDPIQIWHDLVTGVGLARAEAIWTLAHEAHDEQAEA